MSSRDAILASVRANLPKVSRPLPTVPRFDDTPPASLTDAFTAALTRMGGTVLTPEAGGSPLAPVHALLRDSQAVCSTVPEIAGGRPLTADTDPRSLADIDHAVVRATLGVAETGSLLLTDAGLTVNSLAYLAQHLVVLLDPADIVVNLHQAYAHPAFRQHAYAVFHSGPSATADIEGVLIRGAQGVRSLSVLLLPRGFAPGPHQRQGPLETSN